MSEEKHVVGVHPPHVKVKARELYLTTKLTLAEIAGRVAVPLNTVRSWHFHDKWPDERRRLEKDLQERSDFEAARVVQESRVGVMKRHLTVGEKIEDHAEKILDKATEDEKNLKPDDLLSVSKAFQASGNITGRVVGLDQAGGRAGGPTGVAVLINTNFVPTPSAPQNPPGPDPKSPEDVGDLIDVEPEPDEDEEPF
jgi:hypothetical protein